jgi:hypothetical protein
MRNLSRLLAESLQWPRRSFVNGPTRNDALLKPLVIVVIVLVVGPDFFALVELTTLLELMGATLFVIAFALGFQLLAVGALQRLRRLLLPPEYLMLIGIRGRPVAVLCGVSFVAGHIFILAMIGLSSCLLSYAGALQLMRLAA